MAAVPAVVLVVRLTVPVTAPAAVGSNSMFNVAVCPGFRVSGKLTPDMLKPVPVTAPALMISGAVPDEVSVTDCVAGVFRPTSPNATLVEFSVKPGTAAPSSIAQVFFTSPAVAVSVAVCAVVTDDTVALKPAVVAPAGTVTDPGTVTALLLLDKLTASPPVPAAAVNVTVQASVPVLVIDPLLQLSPPSCPAVACPVPLRAMAAVAAVVLVVRVTDPVTAPAAVGSNSMFSVAVCPGFRVSGKLTPDMLKPVPVTAPALMVSGAVPDEVSVTGRGVAELFTVTSPKLRLLVLSVSPGTVAPRSIAQVFFTPPAVAVSVAVCAVVTDDTVALKPAVVAPAGTVTDPGTVTALLLLDRLTASPPVPAAAVNVTVQASVLVIDPLLQLSPPSTPAVACPIPLDACPVPLKLIVAVPPEDALLLTVSVPVSAPGVAGLKCRVTL